MIAVKPAAEPMPRYRILVVDDEPLVTEGIQRYLEREGFDVATAANGEDALSTAHSWSPDVVLLDLMLPGMDGLDVCRALQRESDVAVLMITARGEETDRIVGLEVGADDYITKPFSLRELLARVKAVLRRTSRDVQPDSSAVLKFRGLIVNPVTRQVEMDGKSPTLTAKEFDLLYFLASHPSQVFTREQLMNQVWDYTYAGDYSTVTVHIRRLREKIEPDPVRPKYVKTVWGVGYKFEP